MKTHLFSLRPLAHACFVVGLAGWVGTQALAQTPKAKPETEKAAASATAASANGKGKVHRANADIEAVAGTTTPGNNGTDCTNSPGHIGPGLPRCPEGVVVKKPAAASVKK